MPKNPTFSQPLANLWLKTNQLGSTIPLRNVTPAEVMFLVSDHHVSAGGDPIVKDSLVEIDADKEAAKLEAAQKERDKLQSAIDALGETELTDEIRERRANVLQTRLKVQEGIIEDLQRVAALRNLSPAQERRRLTAKYGLRRISRFYPGQIPTLPQTFEEARQSGVQSQTYGERLLTVGAEGDQY